MTYPIPASERARAALARVADAARAAAAAARRYREGAPRGPEVFTDEELAARLEAGLVLPRDQRPAASVIIPVYGKLAVTWTCLDALASVPSGASLEIIVVDDRSPDGTAEALARVEGLRLVSNTRNLGFIGACNAGAEHAAGAHLCFLNNDTVVRPGWLGALLETFERHPEAGVAGARLLFPDGRIQEAGGIVFRDAAGGHYGRGLGRGRSEHGFVREVDYVSGACLCIPRDLFAELGGFDAHFAPAYYEDTDLAFRVRAAGRAVLYQPAAEVFHYEGLTNGRDLRSGVKRHQLVNHERFFRRWREELVARHPPPGRRTRACADRRVGPELVVVGSGAAARVAHLAIGARGAGFRVAAWSAGGVDPRLPGLGVEALDLPSLRAVLRSRAPAALLLAEGAPPGGDLARLLRWHPETKLLLDLEGGAPSPSVLPLLHAALAARPDSAGDDSGLARYLAPTPSAFPCTAAPAPALLTALRAVRREVIEGRR